MECNSTFSFILLFRIKSDGFWNNFYGSHFSFLLFQTNSLENRVKKGPCTSVSQSPFVIIMDTQCLWLYVCTWIVLLCAIWNFDVVIESIYRCNQYILHWICIYRHVHVYVQISDFDKWKGMCIDWFNVFIIDRILRVIYTVTSKQYFFILFWWSSVVQKVL